MRARSLLQPQVTQKPEPSGNGCWQRAHLKTVLDMRSPPTDCLEWVVRQLAPIRLRFFQVVTLFRCQRLADRVIESRVIKPELCCRFAFFVQGGPHFFDRDVRGPILDEVLFEPQRISIMTSPAKGECQDDALPQPVSCGEAH